MCNATICAILLRLTLLERVNLLLINNKNYINKTVEMRNYYLYEMSQR